MAQVGHLCRKKSGTSFCDVFVTSTPTRWTSTPLISRESPRLSWTYWRERMGIEPTHQLVTDAAVLKTGETTRYPSAPKDDLGRLTMTWHLRYPASIGRASGVKGTPEALRMKSF